MVSAPTLPTLKASGSVGEVTSTRELTVGPGMKYRNAGAPPGNTRPRANRVGGALFTRRSSM